MSLSQGNEEESVKSARLLYMEKYKLPASSLKRFIWEKTKMCGGWSGVSC